MRQLILLAAVYTVAGKLGLLLASIHVSASPVWPPTGIAIAGLLLFGLRAWPAVLLGAFIVNVTNEGHVPSSVGIAIGNTLEAVVAVVVTERLANGARAFARPSTIFRFAALAAVPATMVSATIGVGSLVLTGHADPALFGPVWLTWWLGDLGGAILVTPLILLWATRVPELRGQGTGSELAALLSAAVVTATLVFGQVGPFGPARAPVAFLTLPVLVWAAFRFGPRIAATVIAVLGLLAVWGTLQGTGPFIRGSANESLLLLQAFMGTVSITALALAAGAVERQASEERLREAEERLREAEARKVAARDEFLGIAAHELRTPIASLQLAVQYLQREAASPDGMRRSLGALDSQTRRLGQLINQLLDTVRIQTGRLELDITVQDVVALTRGMVEEAQAASPRHVIALTAPPELRAAVDPLRYEQVVRNLLDNAVKFSPNGSRVDVELATVGVEVLLAVRDRGVGVPEEHRARIFDRSYQGPVDRRSGGLGLGLHVSRHIVELHGGRIQAEFPHDGGTRIVVHLPVGAEATEAREGRE